MVSAPYWDQISLVSFATWKWPVHTTIQFLGSDSYGMAERDPIKVTNWSLKLEGYFFIMKASSKILSNPNPKENFFLKPLWRLIMCVSLTTPFLDS